MSDLVSTQAFPSLDAWQRYNEARDKELIKVHKDTIESILYQAGRGKSEYTLHIDGSWLEVERSGWWLWARVEPVGRLKRLIEKFQADGFTVQFHYGRALIVISWNLNAPQ